MKNNTIDAKLVYAQAAIDNALGNDTIKTAMAVYGYDEARLLAGKALLETAQTKQDAQKKEYGEQYAATDELDAALRISDKSYMLHVKVARIALRTQRGIAEALQLDGKRKKTYAGRIQQAAIFYTNALANEAVKTRLAEFGIDESKLLAGQAAVKEVEARLAAQQKEKGEAQAATKARDEALEALMDWMADFVSIARIAMEDDSQQLEALGIIVT